MSKLELIQDIENKAEKSYVDTLPTADKIPSLAFSNQIYKQNESLNQDLVAGMYDFFNATDGFPDGYTTDNDFYLFVTAISPTESSFQRHILLDVRDNRTFSRSKRSGELTPWKEIITQEQFDVLSRNVVQAEGDYKGDANTFVLNGIVRDIGEVTNLPSSFGNLMTFSSGTGGGNYLTQLYANQRYIGFRCGADDTISSEWRQLATTDITVGLDNKIGVLNSERGYLKSRIVVDANELVENGKYTSVRTNTPTNEMWNIEVIKHNDTFLTQIATLFADKEGFKKEAKMYIRNKGQGVWTDWQEVATTDRLDELPLLNGWTLWGGSAYPPKVFKVGNICSIVGCIVGGTATSGTTIFTLPEGFRPKRTESTPVLGADGKVYNLNISLNGNANTDNSWGTTWTNSLKMINIVFEV